MPYSRVFYHFIWTTKHRLPLMTNELNQRRIFNAIAAKVIDLKGIAHAVGGIEDHVHLVATAPPSLSLAQFYWASQRQFITSGFTAY